MLRTSVQPSDLDSGQVVSSYKALAQVERAFRAFNTDLDIRPIRHRTENQFRPRVPQDAVVLHHLAHAGPTRAHPVHRRRRARRPGRPAQPVTPATRSPRAQAKAATKQTPAAQPVHSFATLLDGLHTICLNTIAPADPALPGFRLITTPTVQQREALSLLGVSHRLGVA